ncbi:MAG: electron transport complex subunit RsxC [Betaproteobacteria bacterium]|nr:electron transport complex subunit RsxC [Betaproteobacteria bacterium]
MRKLHRFHGGVHPPDRKAESTRLPIARAPLPRRLVVPLHQHLGHGAKPLVQAGDRVLKGQMIGRAEGYVSAAIHAPTSGTVRALEMHPVPHPSGLSDLCVMLEPDGEERWVERGPLDYANLDPQALRLKLRDAGVVGLGGAAFPSYVKLSPGARQRLSTLVINGAECEPYITCDDMLMRERADEIVQGVRLIRLMLHAEEVLIGIEDNKPEAIAALRNAVKRGTLRMDVVPVPTVYPGGGERQLIKVLTGAEVPSGKRPVDIGMACFNVHTAYTVHRAVAFGEPVVSRVVTVAGNVLAPRNYEVPLGMRVADLAALASPLADTSGYLMGGPMMGFELPSADIPVVKASNCIIAKSQALFPAPPPAMPCIRCGRCAQACPAQLQPMDLFWFARARNFGKAQEYSLFDCIECGCCSFVCPSHIPLVQYYRFAKGEIWAKERERKAADLARSRHEFRQLRIERDKQERLEKLARKTAAARSHAAPAPAMQEAAANPADDPRKAAIEAAIERARTQKATITPRNVDNLTPEKQAEIARIEERRKKIREMARDRIEP